MGYRLGCPECKAWTSEVYRAFEDSGDCPYCGADLNTPDNSQHYLEQSNPDLARALAAAARVKEFEAREAKLRELANNGFTYADYVPVVVRDELLAILDGRGEST